MTAAMRTLGASPSGTRIHTKIPGKGSLPIVFVTVGNRPRLGAWCPIRFGGGPGRSQHSVASYL